MGGPGTSGATAWRGRDEPRIRRDSEDRLRDAKGDGRLSIGQLMGSPGCNLERSRVASRALARWRAVRPLPNNWPLHPVVALYEGVSVRVRRRAWESDPGLRSQLLERASRISRTAALTSGQPRSLPVRKEGALLSGRCVIAFTSVAECWLSRAMAATLPTLGATAVGRRPERVRLRRRGEPSCLRSARPLASSD